jgi:hypothetical protein
LLKSKIQNKEELIMKNMKAKLLVLAAATLGAPLLAQPVTLPNPPGLCSNAPPWLVAAINAVLTLLGLGPIC